ncbi:hypothetical protein [Tigheibacillus jepli]|uniref:hypothetical protein n=1 Tax=Tigheibacillus jepli TaxID=3035914 RepID=UPI00387E0532
MDALNAELYRLHQGLISFATNKYANTINQQIKLLEKPFLKDEETKDIFQTGLTPWIVAHVPCLENHQTIFQSYYRKNKSKMSPSARNMLAKWSNISPSVYEVVSIDRPMKHFVLIKDVMTENAFYIPFQNANEFMEGSLLIGVVIPFANHHNFFFTMIKLFHRDTAAYRDLLQEYTKRGYGLTKQFPEFLARALTNMLDEVHWKKPEHEEVARLFVEHMVNRNMDDKLIVDGISLWQTYCRTKNPPLKKIAPYAAALDYYVQKNVAEKISLNQVQLAKEYGTSPAMISTIFRRLSGELADKAE